jgi:CBS domain-containing protein/SAM-dependent methyltransferase
MGYIVSDVMTPCEATDGQQSLLDLVRMLASSGQAMVPVVDGDGRLEGIANGQEVIGLLGRGQDLEAIRVADIAREALTIGPWVALEDAGDLLPEHQGLAVVLDGDDVLGLLQLWEVEKFLDAVAALGPTAGQLITEVSPQDTYGARYSRGNTLAAGVAALQRIRDALAATGRQRVSKLLDFPSGYGRILRVLKAAFPEAALAAGDIDRGAVDFCAHTFGATPIYSTEEPQDITIEDTYDVIWCGSLLTHTRPDRWAGFLSVFHDCLTDDGVLVFTVSGPRLRDTRILRRFALQEEQAEQVVHSYDRDGFGFSDYPGTPGYGISLASPGWVQDQLESAGLRLVSYIQVGWDAPAPRQDVISCVRG